MQKSDWMPRVEDEEVPIRLNGDDLPHEHFVSEGNF